MKIAGLDIGTTGCKCTVFDEQGKYLNKAYKDYPVRRSVSGHEVDVSTIMDGVYAVVAERSNASTVIPFFCNPISSKRVVLNAVVLAPIHPIVKRFIPLTTRQIAAKSLKFSWNFSESGCTTCGFNTVKGT